MPRPRILVTCDLRDGRHAVRQEYVHALHAAGASAALLPAAPLGDRDRLLDLLRDFDGVLLTGGGDPDTTPFGEPVHPATRLIEPARQAAELGLFEALDQRPELPVLGVCLGMQMMGLTRGARLLQHLDDHLEEPELHRDDRIHPVEGRIGSGPVCSEHHQALADPGSLEVVGRSPDGVIEAVVDEDRPFYLGVQWHPERSPDGPLGPGLIGRLVSAARRRR